MYKVMVWTLLVFDMSDTNFSFSMLPKLKHVKSVQITISYTRGALATLASKNASKTIFPQKDIKVSKIDYILPASLLRKGKPRCHDQR